MLDEEMRITPNYLMHIGSPILFDADENLQQLQMLMTVAYDGQEDIIRDPVAEIVSTYHTVGEHGWKFIHKK